MDGVQRLTVMINRKDYYGRNCNPHFWFRRGYLWKCEHVRMDFCRCFLHRAHYQRRSESGISPPGATSAEGGRGGSPQGAQSAPKGEWPYTEAPTMWSCPD